MKYRLSTKPLCLAGLLSSCLIATPAIAADTDLNFSGFATIAYGKSLDDDEGSLNNIEPDGNYRKFNKFGLRLDADLQDNLTFTTQMTANGDDDYEPAIDWLFATYYFTPGLAVSVGKVRAPLFMYSDFLDVGYAYQWITPPFEVYGVPSFSSTEGIKLAWTADIGGDWTSEMVVWAGEVSEEEKELNATLEIKDGLGLAWTIERDWLTLRAVYFEGVASADLSENADFQELEGGFQMIEGLLDADELLDPVRSDISLNEEDAQFMGLGLFMDFEHVFIGAESTLIEVGKSIATPDKLKSHYVMAGVRLPGAVSLSLTYSINDDTTNEEVYAQYFEILDPISAANPDVAPVIEFIGGELVDAVESQHSSETETYTIGARWDFHRSAALKAEYLIQDSTVVKTSGDEERDPTAYRISMDIIF